MKLQTVLAQASSTLAIGISFVTAPAFAQSTGSAEFDNEIVVSGAAQRDVAGIQVPDSTKSKQVLTQEFIANQRPGQSINEIINLVPGVSFQNNDPYGSSGGTLNIRGFDSTRISQTFDGLPLNDTGNYALYSNQQLDPELIEQVNVNLGTTDVDSPTAAATGSTVNYRSITPSEEFGARMVGSVGEYGYFRMFGLVQLGTLTSFGTRAWIAGSHSENDNPYNRTSYTNKDQFNAKVYQPVGSNGDFISVAGHYNINRNRNFSSIPLRTDLTQLTVSGTRPNQTLGSTPRVVGSASSNRFPLNKDEREYTIAPCTVDTPQAGIADVPNACGTRFDESYNPSNTWNIRVNSRFTLTDNLVLTVDPNFQYTRANGGLGAVRAHEGFVSRPAAAGVAAIGPIYGYIGGRPYFGGIDLNGDGDVLDTSLSSTGAGVTVYAPSETNTRRYGLVANLIWDITESQTVRVNYSYDYGRHKQTGEVTLVGVNGLTSEFFPENNALLDPTGEPMQKRNRRSKAILNQVSAEYRGEFLEDRLTVNLGVRAPWFTRKLNNLCVTETGGTFVDCFNNAAMQAAFLAANPGYVPPIKRTIKYNKVLPTAGVNFSLAPSVSLYGNYTKGLSVPGTDNLYQSLGYTADQASPSPETSDNFDVGVRYTSSKIQAQLAGWYTLFNNRLAQSFDPDLNISIFRNLGKVDKYGLDGSISYAPVPQLNLYVFGSVLKSKIKDNVQTGVSGGQPVFALTEGKREGGAPTYMFGGRVQGQVGPVQLGIQAKRTGPRYLNDQNLPIFQTYTLNGTATNYQVYGSKAPAYEVVDLDAKLGLSFLGLNDTTYLQLNVTNLFDKFYVAGFSSNTEASRIPNAYIGSPRTVSGSINMQF
jgi:iron complex outermembrane receptor protein